MKKIIRNKVRCKKCNDIIESKHNYDFRYCKCGSILWMKAKSLEVWMGIK